MQTQPNQTSQPVYIQLEFTPNPNTLKYSVNRILSERGAVFTHTPDMARDISPLATRLFETPGIQAVMIGKDFVTVTKSESGDWDTVHKNTSDLLEKHLSQDLPIFSEAWLASMNASPTSGAVDSEDVRIIKELLDREIRPAVAMDGGDITFDRYEDGVLYVYLQGSCAGCPSSTATLKMGIEARLQEVLPGLREVVSI
jgi:Fe-S cluster biogenesis protein NfuA